MKKSISILLVIVMVSGILSGCGIKKSNTENNKENTQEYLSSYISLAEMLDIFINTAPFTDIYTTYSGYEKTNAVPYTFQYKKWQTMPDNIVLKGTNTTTFYTLF